MQAPTGAQTRAPLPVTAGGVACEVEYTFKFAPLINDPEITELVRIAAERQHGASRVREAARPNMGSEDFACFAQALLSSFFYLGIAPAENSPVAHHHPEFKIDEVLKDGIAVFCRTVAEFFGG